MEEEEDPARVMAVSAAIMLGVEAVTWERVQHETRVDRIMVQLVAVVEKGFPYKGELPDSTNRT